MKSLWRALDSVERVTRVLLILFVLVDFVVVVDHLTQSQWSAALRSAIWPGVLTALLLATRGRGRRSEDRQSKPSHRDSELNLAAIRDRESRLFSVFVALRPPTKLDYWAVRRPVIYSLCVGGGWGLFLGIWMSVGDVFASWDNGSVVFNVIFATIFGAVTFGPFIRWITVRQVRKWEAAHEASTPG